MKQQRYLDDSGNRDWIDECADSFSIEEPDGAMKFTIGKYYRRLGKKDPIAQEQAKIDDYIARWINYEFNNCDFDELEMPPSVALVCIRDGINEVLEFIRGSANGS